MASWRLSKIKRSTVEARKLNQKFFDFFSVKCSEIDCTCCEIPVFKLRKHTVSFYSNFSFIEVTTKSVVSTVSTAPKSYNEQQKGPSVTRGAGEWKEKTPENVLRNGKGSLYRQSQRLPPVTTRFLGMTTAAAVPVRAPKPIRCLCFNTETFMKTYLGIQVLEKRCPLVFFTQNPPRSHVILRIYTYIFLIKLYVKNSYCRQGC